MSLSRIVHCECLCTLCLGVLSHCIYIVWSQWFLSLNCAVVTQSLLSCAWLLYRQYARLKHPHVLHMNVRFGSRFLDQFAKYMSYTEQCSFNTDLVVWEEVIQFEGRSNASSDMRRSLACKQGILFWQFARELLETHNKISRSDSFTENNVRKHKTDTLCGTLARTVTQCFTPIVSIAQTKAICTVAWLMFHWLTLTEMNCWSVSA